MKKKYERLIAFKEKVNLLAWNEFNKDKEIYLEEFAHLINEINFNINEVIEDYDNIPYRYVTPLLYILEINHNCFIDLIFEKGLPLINRKIVVNDKLEYDLLTVMFESLQFKGASSDVLTPLIFHFEDIGFLNRIRSSDKKLNIIDYFLLKSKDFVVSNDFLELLKSKRTEFQKDKKRFLMSSLKLSLGQSLNEIKKIKSENKNLIDIEKKIKSLKQTIDKYSDVL